MTTPIAKNRNPGDPKPTAPGHHAWRVSLDVKPQPLREMRLELGLDVQIVYFAIHLPVAGGVKLRIPVLTTVKPKFYSPTRAQHL
jgi:hypothetical protein